MSSFDPHMDAIKAAFGLHRDAADALSHAVVACVEDLPELATLLAADPLLASAQDAAGYGMLHYAIAFGAESSVETLLSAGADPLEEDPKGWFPLAWAIHTDSTASVLALLQAGALTTQQLANGMGALDLVADDSHVKAWLVAHNIGGRKLLNDFYRETVFPSDPVPLVLAPAVVTPTLAAPTFDDMYQAPIVDTTTATFDDFDYSRLAPNQFIKFVEADILPLLDVAVACYHKHPHHPRYPAAIVFQMVRYAQSVDEELAATVFDLFITKVRAVTHTKSGMALVESSANGDIVVTLYWLGAVQLLYFYVSHGNLCQLHPKWVLELVATTQQLCALLAFAVCARLEPLLGPCLLDYTLLVETAHTAYASDWRLFKKKPPPSSLLEDIVRMLHPPLLQEQSRPSPVKITQTLDALGYVLGLHTIHPLLGRQCVVLVVHWIGATVFNRVIAQKRYCLRAKAMQLRLNLTQGVEDWLQRQPQTIPEPEWSYADSYLEKLAGVPVPRLQTATPATPAALQFYYQPMYQLGRWLLAPATDLLGFLQVVSHLDSVEMVQAVRADFPALNLAQMAKAADRYRHEVDEPRVPKAVARWLSKTAAGLADTQEMAVVGVAYASTREPWVFLNPEATNLGTLPCGTEMAELFGGGVGGVDITSRKLYEPTLPIAVLDDVDEVKGDEEAWGGISAPQEAVTEERRTGDFEYQGALGGDSTVSGVSAPLVAHTAWAEVEANPW